MLVYVDAPSLYSNQSRKVSHLSVLEYCYAVKLLHSTRASSTCAPGHDDVSITTYVTRNIAVCGLYTWSDVHVTRSSNKHYQQATFHNMIITIGITQTVCIQPSTSFWQFLWKSHHPTKTTISQIIQEEREKEWARELLFAWGYI